MVGQPERGADPSELAQIADMSPDVVVVFAGDGLVEHVNNAARESLGIGDRDALPDSITRFCSPEAAQVMKDQIIPAALLAGSWIGELSIMDARGRPRPAQVFVLAHPGPAGSTKHLSMTAHDISQYKEVERVKEEFISTVSHALRTPLTSIRGALGLIEGGAMGYIPPDAMNMVHVASSNTAMLIKLITDIMDLDQDLEKMRAGRLVLHRERIDLDSAASEAIASIGAIAGQSGVRLVKDLAGDPPTVQADPDRLAQLVLNLLSNAIKFSPRDSTVTVTVGPGSAAGTAAISVTDQGPGIPADKRQYVFDRFQQADPSSTRGKSGSGLGLAIARDIAELHGGTLEVSSPPGGGVTFTFTMPTADPAVAQV